MYSHFVRINHSIYIKFGCKYPRAKRAFVYTVHNRFLCAHSAYSVSFNICSPLIDFTSQRNGTYFYRRHHCALRLRHRYILDIYLVSTPLYLRIVWCFFRWALLRRHNKPSSFAAIYLRCVSIFARMSWKVVVVCLPVIVFSTCEACTNVHFLLLRVILLPQAYKR